ncbi:flagellar protein FlgN [Clostridium sp. A1-XYC3]|uniref:Flagellar protein FlgN n=1 Tax=Clostridium tanneri TaxID=3037988 RepID=A0ABU4JNI6_9CLOT|nr:flagellar protein FlgN [Clostridium sp. A1-XYC3]MDW8799706.1 flagellar protein FlgN [Clostridium sp. A1-XYC3]
MVSDLNRVILEEHKALQALLSALDGQFEYLTKREVFALDKIAATIEECAKEVAKFEIQRRKLTNGQGMSEIVNQLKNEELENNYRNIKNLLEEIQLQKDTNELLIRQGLGFTTQMLNVLNPDKGPKTYNPYGKKR